MISVAAIRMQQFGVQFYQASLSASDIDKLVRFEVLSYGEQGQPVRGRKKAPAPTKVNWDLLERRIGAEREGVSAPDYPQEDRRARAVLRAVPSGARSAVDPRRGDHLVRRSAALRADGRGQHGRHAEGPGTRRHPARDRRPAPAARPARRHRSLRRRAVLGAGRDLRSPARRSRRADVRDDQREAHAAQPVASRVALRAAALQRRQPRRGARHRPRAERSRGLAAARRDQAARRGQGTGRAGAARAGTEEAVRDATRSGRGARGRRSAKSRGSFSSTT